MIENGICMSVAFYLAQSHLVGENSIEAILVK